ncbi:MAG: HIT domain-containing protein [Acidimicrobiales bacterium]
MSLDRLWAGWRAAFLAEVTLDDHNGDDGCILCRVLSETGAVVWRGERCAAILNAYPYTAGHLMVVPLRHVGELEEVNGDEAVELWATVSDAVRALKSAYRPDGLNMGANLGRAGGAGVPGHFHVHLVPRWDGDTNFMTTVAEARVVPEALPVTLQRVRSAWPA